MCNHIKTIAVILLSTISVACNQANKVDKNVLAFVKPVISQPVTTDSLKYIKADFLDDLFPRFAGKHKFSDSLFIPYKQVRDTAYSKDFIDERIVRHSDSLMTDGLEIVPDYSSNIYLNEYGSKYAEYYYPVYIMNQTPAVKTFIGKDSYAFGIQEALDTNKQWRPIEGRGLDFCGNGYWGLKVYPREFIMILFPKYSGNYKTKIRVRIKNGENLYVSKAYDGTINESQLYLKEDSYLYRELIENKASAIQYLFYGAKPFGTDDKNFGFHAVWTK